jgi:hypothetical protein
MPVRSPGFLLPLIVLCASAVACSKTNTPAPADAATGAAPTASKSAASDAGVAYEVVTVERPESVEAYHKAYKATYDICATTRATLKMPPPAPMKVPPADFISQRTTYTSDGKAYLVKQEYFVYKSKMEEPTYSCDTYLEKTSSTQLIRGGKVYDAAVDESGKRSSEPPSEWDLPRESKSELYTVPKSVKGHAVKCMPMLPNTEELITELCIADLKPGTLTGPAGEPIVLASRVTSAQKMIGVVLTEPVSVKVGEKIDKAVFDAAAAP